MPIPLDALSYTALNLHTANKSPKSLCGIGIYVIERGKSVLLKYILVKPNTKSFTYEQYGYFRKDDLLHAPTLPEIWPELSKYIVGKNIVVYNIEQTLRILHDSLKSCGIEMPDFNAVDVCDMFNTNHGSYTYASLAATCGYDDEFENGDVYENLKLYRACIEYGARRGNTILQKVFGAQSVKSDSLPQNDKPVFTSSSDFGENNAGCSGCLGCLIPVLFVFVAIIWILK